MHRFIIFILICSVNLGFSKEHVVETPAGNIIFTTGEKEISQRKFFGADLWFTGEVINKKRNVLSILYNSKDIKLKKEISSKEFNVHKKEMTSFAKKRGYTDVKFWPYEYVKINKNLGYHSLKWSYKKQKDHFLEESYYVECGNVLYIAKALTFDKSKKDQSKFKRIIETSRCVK